MYVCMYVWTIGNKAPRLCSAHLPAKSMTPQGCAGGAVGSGRQRCAQAAPAEDARSGAGVLRAQQAACNGQHPRAVGWLLTTCDVCIARSGVRGVGAPTRCVAGSMRCTVERVLRGTRDSTAVPNVQHAPSDITGACPGFHAPALCCATPRAPRCRHAFGTTVGAMRHAPCDGRGAMAISRALLAGGGCLCGRAMARRCTATAAG